MSMTSSNPVLQLQPETTRPSGDDIELKQLALQDRRQAFDGVVRKYRDKLFQHALYMLKDSQEAFDVTQETLIRAFQEPHFFAEDFRIRPWLFRVLTNLCYNITRDKSRRGGLLKLMGYGQSKESVQAIDTLLDKELRSDILKGLSAVPEKYRTILLLKYYDDLSYIEISEVLGCKLGTVMSRLSRAREKLQSAMATE